MTPAALPRSTALVLLGSLAAALLAGCGTELTDDVDGARGPAAGPTKRALIVAISKYDAATGWRTIHSTNDVPMVRAALLTQGFQDIHVLTNAQATAAGIRQAFDEHLLPATAGDVVVFHFSGHGQRLTDDDDNEEVDGYDEALVPFDAPKNPGPGYDGSKHLRDDEVHDLVQRLRARVAADATHDAGNVVVLLDSCFSGTGGRGDTFRGGADPIGPPRAGHRPEARGQMGGGFFTRGESTAEDPRLAPYVVFSAAQANQVDQEMEDPTRRNVMVGPLSWALGRALATLQGEPTYRNLFAEVRAHMREQYVPNEPQIEGDEDTRIFSGQAVTQKPFVRIVSAAADGREVKLEMGALGNLLAGAEVEIHRAGTLQPTAGSLLAVGKVVGRPGLTSSTARLDRAVARRTLERGRGFVTRYAFGDLRMRVQVKDLGDPALRTEILALLREKVAAAELVDSNPEVTVELDTPEPPTAPRPVTVSTATGTVILNRVARTTPGLADAISNRLLDLARNRYLSRVSLDDPKLRYRLEIIPVEVSDCEDPSRPEIRNCTVEEIPKARWLSAGGQIQLPIGSWYTIRVQPGEIAAHVSVLDLMADGRIHNYWPPGGQEQPWRTDRPVELDALFRVTEPDGIEKVLLFATREPINFWPFETQETLAARGEPRGEELVALDVFAPLFDDERVRSRGEVVYPVGGVGSHAVEYTVVRKEP